MIYKIRKGQEDFAEGPVSAVTALQMFSTYKDIFDKRGLAYHEAMLKYPHARSHEFESILEQALVQSGQTLCDMPSGGGYIQRFIQPENVKLLCY